MAGENVYIERKLQLLKRVEVMLKTIVEQNSYDIAKFAPLISIFRNEINLDQHWQVFKDNFESVHTAFLRKMLAISPKLTQQDIKHCVYIKMNFETKEIAAMFNIKPNSVQISPR
ncbi:MAG: hypothetical protein HC896_07535 [Bacteroidales bacterium]|nr:hypothetical protein [Bacteroidales bacterium]